PELKSAFSSLFTKAASDGGYGKAAAEMSKQVPVRINGASGDGSHNMFSTDAQRAQNHMVEGAPKNVAEMITNRPTPDAAADLASSPYKPAETQIGHGSVLIAAITSCTNTSNPSVMLASGLLAKKAVERGLKVNPAVKTSLAPGSRVVTDYLAKTGLQ